MSELLQNTHFVLIAGRIEKMQTYQERIDALLNASGHPTIASLSRATGVHTCSIRKSVGGTHILSLKSWQKLRSIANIDLRDYMPQENAILLTQYRIKDGEIELPECLKVLIKKNPDKELLAKTIGMRLPRLNDFLQRKVRINHAKLGILVELSGLKKEEFYCVCRFNTKASIVEKRNREVKNTGWGLLGERPRVHYRYLNKGATT